MSLLPTNIMAGAPNHIAHHDKIHKRVNTWVDVQDPSFGVVGTGVAETAAIQAAIDAVPPYGTLHFSLPAVTYGIDDELILSDPINIVFDGLASITQTASAKGCFDITAAGGVTITGGELIGPQYATYVIGEKAIRCVGASAASFTDGVRLQGVTISGWGEYGVYAQYLKNFWVEGCTIKNIAYAGFMGLSVTHGFILDNDIDMGSPVGTASNAYGISLTRTDNDSLATQPRSADVLVRGNDVRNIPIWEGLDTHGGLRITFDSNHVYNTKIGVNCGDARNTAHAATWGAVDCHVTNNTIDSGVTDGSRGNGINFHGDGRTLGTPLEKGTGTIIGNTIRGHGLDTSSADGAIYAYCTQGLVIANNSIIACGPNGVCLDYDNYACAITGNTVTDVWTTGAFLAAAVCLRAPNNTVIADGNMFVEDSKVATHVLDYGFHVYNFAGNRLQLGKNHSRLATYYVIDAAGSGSVTGRLRSVITTLTPGLIAAGATYTSGNIAVTVGGTAELGDAVEVSFNPALPDGCVGTAKITATNVAKVSISNVTAGGLTPTAGSTVAITVTKPELDG